MNKRIAFLIILTNLVLPGLLMSQFALADDAGDTMDDIGHDFDEAMWAVVYDFEDDYCKEDLTGDWEDPGKDDEDEDETFYLVYVNEMGIEMAYVAMEYVMRDGEISWMPYQSILQHWNTPSGKETFVTNTFAGLVAYDDLDYSGNPSEDDDMYIGWSFYQSEILDLVNTELTGVEFDVETDPDDFIKRKEPEQEDGVTTFGIEYNSIFTVWQDLEVYDDYDGDNVVPEGVRALSMMDHLEFEYEYEVKNNDGVVEAVMSITYDIGQMSTLVVFDDNKTEADLFGGYNQTTATDGRDYVIYNETSAIAGRINGSLGDGVPAMGLSMIQYVHTVTVDIDTESTDDDGDEVDQDSDDEIDEIDIHMGDEKIFNTDFEIKEEYSLKNNSETFAEDLKVHTRLVEQADLEADFFDIEVGITKTMVGKFARQVSQPIADELDAEKDLDLDHASYYYLVSFPEWDGYEIEHDPVYTAFGKIPLIYPWTLVTIGLVASVAALVAMAVMIQKKKKLIKTKQIDRISDGI